MKTRIVYLTIMLAACSGLRPENERSPVDAGEQRALDAGTGSTGRVDAGVRLDGGTIVEVGTPNPSLVPTSGGGLEQSANFRLRSIVSPPMPVGTARGTIYKVRLGPGAAQHGQSE